MTYTKLGMSGNENVSAGDRWDKKNCDQSCSYWI